LILPLLTWSQYPVQKIEGKDTLVVMTKEQAVNINETFRKNKDSIDYYRNEAIQYITFSYKLGELLSDKIKANDSLKIASDSLIRLNLAYQDSCVANLKILKRQERVYYAQEVLALTTWVSTLVWFLSRW
jgi:hypothetical protein